MASNAHIQQSVQALATEILELSKTYDPNNAAASEPELVLKANELISTIQTPMGHATSFYSTMGESATVRTLLSFNALQSIPATSSISLSELENVTGAQASLLERLLRLPVASGFLKMNDDRTYSHTSISLGYTGIVGSLFSHIYDEFIPMMMLPDYFKEKGKTEPDGEKSSTHNPATWRHGQEGKTTFEIIEQNPERVENFQLMMSMVEQFRPYTGFYDYGKLATSEPDRVALVDLGGGDGKTIAKILEAYPELKPEQCLLQDLEKTVELAKQNPAVPKGVQFQTHSFFEPQPIQGAKAYQFRAVCHDWSDTMVIKMLKNIVPAMAPDSKVLIADGVLPESNVTGFAAAMDVGMLCIGGKERTKANFEAVLDAAGLKLDGISAAPGEMQFAVVEASLKKQLV